MIEHVQCVRLKCDALGCHEYFKSMDEDFSIFVDESSLEEAAGDLVYDIDEPWFCDKHQEEAVKHGRGKPLQSGFEALSLVLPEVGKAFEKGGE